MKFSLNLGLITCLGLFGSQLHAAPVCTQNAVSVINGWGWENGASCVAGGPQDSPTTVVPFCEDTPPVGDGWGWNGTGSCRIISPTSGPAGSDCIDTPPLGNGWGWNGIESCLVPPTPTPTPTPVAGSCIDTSPLNDGYGWNGIASCPLPIVQNDQPEPVPAPPLETTPMDIDWSWALDQWFGCRVINGDTGNRWTWKLNADGLMVDQFNTIFGAWSEVDYNGDRVVLFLDQGGRQNPSDIWIDENSFRMHAQGSDTAWGICSKVTDPVAWLNVVEPGVVNNRPHSRFDNTRWYCSIRVGPTWVEGYTIELHRNGDVIGYEQRFDSRWNTFGVQGNPRYFSNWQAADNDTRVRSDFYGLLEWDRNSDTLNSGPDTFRCRLPKYFNGGTIHPVNTIFD